MRTIENWELRPRAPAHNWKIQGVRFFWNKFCICREQLFKFDANVGEMCKANSWNSPLNGPGSSVGSFRGGESRKEHKSQKKWEDTNICWGWSIQRAKRRRRKGKAELDFAKAFFPLFEGACYRGGRRKCLRPCSTAFAFTWNARRWRRSTLHIVHYSLHFKHCTMHIALERPLSGLRLACWPDFETWCTSLELYNLSTRSTLLQPFEIVGSRQGAAVRRMHLALPRVETSGFGSGLDSAWTYCV